METDKRNVEPIILTVDNIKEYFLSVLPNFSEESLSVFDVSEIDDYTNSAYIFKVTTKGDGNSTKNYYLKQSREKVKKKDFCIPQERVIWEAENAKRFNQYIGELIAPEFQFVDEENCVGVMDDALTGGGEMLISAYKKGKLFPEHGRIFGEILGKLHGKSYGLTNHFYGDDNWNEFLTVNIFTEHYYTGFQKYFGKEAVNRLIRESRLTKHSFCHMDLVMKNIIVNRKGTRILDFEGSTAWDPAQDVGIFLMPWIIEIDRKTAECTKFVKDFFTHYNSQLKVNGVSDWNVEEIARRSLRMTAIILIHHTRGSDPYDFLRGREDEICDLAVDLLKGKKQKNSRLISELYQVTKPLLQGGEK